MAGLLMIRRLLARFTTHVTAIGRRLNVYRISQLEEKK